MANELKSATEQHEEGTVTVAPAAGAVRLDDEVLTKMGEGVSGFGDIAHDAHTATDYEHDMTVREALRLYPKAIAFSIILSMSLVMEGYDTALLGGFFAYPVFRKKFGVPVNDGSGSYQVTAHWQSTLSAMCQVGEIVGLYLAGIMAEKYGYKKTLLGSLVFMISVIFIMFFAQNISMLMAGELLCGLPWGAWQTLSTTYAAEIAPMALRPFLTTFVNLCWAIGQLISAGVLRGFLHRQDDWGWRIPYALQWAWPIPIIVGVLLAPESPWWLVRNGRIEDAKKVLRSLVSAKDSNYSVDRNVAMMIYTDAQERAVAQGTSYLDCFKGIDLRRTEIACCTWLVQIGCGIWFGGNVTYFLQQAGFNDKQAFNFGLGHNAVNVFGTLCSWWAMQHVGRRSLYLWGIAIMLVLLLAVGFMGIPEPSDAIAYGSGSLLMLFTLTYGVTVGPVCYCLVAEMPSTRLRIKTVALARNLYNIVTIAANFLNNPILNPTAWNLRGKGAFIWCGFSVISYVWAYYRLPEPRGLSAGEMDVLFQQKVPARQFTKVKADPFRSAHYQVEQVQPVTFHSKERVTEGGGA
ncbi:Maltose permease MAL31 [Apiospora rasikravindrae]|uniref:Maltose permease MAL31 n=1 Tax=Apiospora rasikravindrae TaxID=990691 RepID=A0ABR1UAR0_9PEZI